MRGQPTRMMTRCVGIASMTGLLLGGMEPSALAGKPGRGKTEESASGPGARAATKKDGPPPVGVMSDGGTDRGNFELMLGGTTLGVVVLLGVVGGLALGTGVHRRHDCDFGYTTSCDVIPPSLDLASAGLSFGLMIPMSVAAGLLLRKGIRIRRDHEAFHAQNQAWGISKTRDQVGLSWRLRF